MPILKCKMCGGTIDPTDEVYGVCDSCGTKSLLKEAKQEESTPKEDVVFKSTGNSLERLLQKSETFLKLNNYHDAKDIFSVISYEYPEDYRGWWGLIICETQHFTLFFDDYTPLSTLYGYVKKLTNENEIQPLQNEYLNYIHKAAEREVKNEIGFVKHNIKALESHIQDYHQKIRELRETIYKTENENKVDVKEIDEKITECLKSKKNMEQTRDMTKNSKGCAWVGCGGSILLIIISLLAGSASAIWFIIVLGIMGGIALMVRYGHPNLESCEKNINNITTQIEQLVKQKNEITSKRHDDIMKSINENSEDIRKAERRIKACKDYISKDIQDIIEYNFAKKCVLNSIPKDIDLELDSLYKIVWGRESLEFRV